MNLYEIKNIKTDSITHFYKSLLPHSHQPEWGLLERVKWQDECSPEEIADAIETLEIEIWPYVPASTRTQYLLSRNPNVFKWAEDCTPQEIASSLSSEVIQFQEIPALTRNQCRLPQTYAVIVTDLSSDIAAEDARVLQVKTLKQRVKALAGNADLTAAEVKEAVMKFIKISLLNKDLD